MLLTANLSGHCMKLDINSTRVSRINMNTCSTVDGATLNWAARCLYGTSILSFIRNTNRPFSVFKPSNTGSVLGSCSKSRLKVFMETPVFL